MVLLIKSSKKGNCSSDQGLTFGWNPKNSLFFWWRKQKRSKKIWQIIAKHHHALLLITMSHKGTFTAIGQTARYILGNCKTMPYLDREGFNKKNPKVWSVTKWIEWILDIYWKHLFRVETWSLLVRLPHYYVEKSDKQQINQLITVSSMGPEFHHRDWEALHLWREKLEGKHPDCHCLANSSFSSGSRWVGVDQ